MTNDECRENDELGKCRMTKPRLGMRRRLGLSPRFWSRMLGCWMQVGVGVLRECSAIRHSTLRQVVRPPNRGMRLPEASAPDSLSPAGGKGRVRGNSQLVILPLVA